jgi:hypothetical protein
MNISQLKWGETARADIFQLERKRQRHFFFLVRKISVSGRLPVKVNVNLEPLIKLLQPFGTDPQ